MWKKSDLYFVSPVVDTLFMGGISILVFLFFRLTLSGYEASTVSDSVITAVAALGWIANWPHFAATSFRLFESPAHIRQFPLTAWLIPVIILLATLGCYIFPISFAPYFLKLYVMWSPYHFSMQTMGVALIYARRAGVEVSPLARTAILGFVLSSLLAQMSHTELSLKTGFLYALSYPHLNIPRQTPTVFLCLMYASLALIVYEFLPTAISQKSRFPWIILVPLATQYLWFIYGRTDFSFQFLVPFFHSLQYLLIAWSMEIHRNKKNPRTSPSAVTARWMLINIFAGGMMFWGIPKLLMSAGWNLGFSMVIVSSAFSMHHYFVDGVIWKLKNQFNDSPLFVNAFWWRKERSV